MALPLAAKVIRYLRKAARVASLCLSRYMRAQNQLRERHLSLQHKKNRSKINELIS